MKRIFILALTAILIFASFPYTLSAYESSEYDGLSYHIEDGTVCIDSCKKDISGAYTIPSEIAGLPVTKIGICAFTEKEKLTEITIPSSVSEIDSEAFRYCTSLSEINIPDTLYILGGGAFHDTKWFNNQPDGPVYIGRVLYSYKNTPTSSTLTVKSGTLGISSSAITYQNQITSVSLPNSLKYIGEMAFFSCRKIKSISIPDSVYHIGERAFYGCKALSSFTFSDNLLYCGTDALFETPWLASRPNGELYIGHTLYEYIGKEDMPKDTKITIKDGTLYIQSCTFMYCTNLAEIIIPDSVIYIGSLSFDGCSSLKSVKIPDNVTELTSDLFSGCTSLNYLSLPCGLRVISNSVFYSTSNLKSIVFRGTEEQWDTVEINPNSQIGSKTVVFEPETAVFRKNKYIADILIGNHDSSETQESVMLNNLLSFNGISQSIESSLNIPEFKTAVASWKTLKIVFKPANGAKDLRLDAYEVYEALILDFIKKVMDADRAEKSSEIFKALDTTNKVYKTATEAKKALDAFEKFAKERESEFLDTVSEWEESTGCESLEKFKTYITNGTSLLKKIEDSSFVSAVGAIAKVSKGVTDFYKRFISFLYAANMPDLLTGYLNEIKQQTNDACLIFAVNKVLTCVNNADFASYFAMADFSLDTALTFMDKCFEAMVKGIPVYGKLQYVYDKTSKIFDVLSNTSKTLEAYYLIQAQSDLLSANEKALTVLKNNYIASGNESDAEKFVYAVKVQKAALETDIDSAGKFIKSATQGGVINFTENLAKKLKNGVSVLFTGSNTEYLTDYEKYEQNKSKIIANCNALFDFVLNNWKTDDTLLKADYPDVYDVFASNYIPQSDFTPVITTAYIAKSGKTVIDWMINGTYYNLATKQNMSVYGLDMLDGCTLSENINGNTSSVDGGYSANNNSISIYTPAYFNKFDKVYTLRAYRNGNTGKQYTAPATVTLSNPCHTVTLSPDNNATFTITDTTLSYYDNVKYHIYRSLNGGEFSEVDCIARNTKTPYRTYYTDKTSSANAKCTYYVISEIPFENGISIKSEMSNSLVIISGMKTLSPLKCDLINKKAPVLTSGKLIQTKDTEDESLQIEISWEISENTTGTKLYRKPSYSSLYTEIADVKAPESSYTDTDAADGVSYEYFSVPYTQNNETTEYNANEISSGEVIQEMTFDNPFDDVPDGKWFTKPSLWCNTLGYITGTSAAEFSPNSKLTRAMFVQILAKVDGASLDLITYKGKFGDVKENNWYAKAVQWAVDNGITGGTSAQAFSPNSAVTREQLATFFTAYAKYTDNYTAPTISLAKYTDASKISSWASESVRWAVENSLISGTSDTTLSPKGVATRAQAAVIFMNFVCNFIYH